MNNTIKRLSDHASASAKVRINTDENGVIRSIDLISYTTRVITIEYREDGRFIECTGTYSATTARHISWFVREYAPDLNYYTFKNAVGQGFIAA